MQPQSPNPNFDFMLKNNQAPKRRLSLPSVNLPKPVKIALAVVSGLFVIIIIFAVLGGGGGSNQPIINVMSRETEILRVTQLAQQQLQLKDPDTQALAATTTSVLTSDQARLQDYLATNKQKVNPKLLTGDLDKNSDTQMQNAAQNNGLDAAYVSYLKTNLALYETDLQTAYKSAGPKGKTILSDAFNSTQTLLQSPPFGA